MRLMGPGGFLNRTTPMPEDRPRKTTKLPDPPMLSDGKQVKFKAWKSDIRKKLRLNHDHYPTPDHQMAYLKSRCEGKALMHVDPRMQDDATNPYKTVDEIFDHLEGVFDNPDRKRLARNEYARLVMDVKTDFVDFLAEFTRLAEEADQPEDLRKQDLYQKIPTLMQNQTMMDVDDDDVTLQQFIRKCQKAAGRISQQFANRNANKTPSRNNNQSSANKGNNLSSTNLNSNASQNSRLTDTEKAALMKEGKCFVCREQGHISRNCPKKKKDSNSTTVATTAPEDPKKKKKTVDLEAAEESDSSGKESA